MGRLCPICNAMVKSSFRIHIIKHSEIPIERRISYFNPIGNNPKRQKKIRKRKLIKHSLEPTKVKNYKSKSICWNSVIKTNFESNRVKY